MHVTTFIASELGCSLYVVHAEAPQAATSFQGVKGHEHLFGHVCVNV
jgi:hypothetical protein